MIHAAQKGKSGVSFNKRGKRRYLWFAGWCSFEKLGNIGHDGSFVGKFAVDILRLQQSGNVQMLMGEIECLFEVLSGRLLPNDGHVDQARIDSMHERVEQHSVAPRLVQVFYGQIVFAK